MPLVVPGVQGSTVDPRNDKPPFNDIRVREALQKSINLAEIASDYYGGTCSPDPVGLTSASLKGWGLPYDQWPQDVKDSYAYDLTAAKALLTAAGHPDGFTTDCVADSSGDIPLLEIVKSDFAKIGVTMNITSMDPGSWTNFVRTTHSQDALAYRSSGFLGLSYQPFRQLIKFQTGNASNYVMVSDPTYDAFYPQALAATTVDQVKSIVTAENLYVAQQHYVISLLNPSSFNVYQPWLKGYAGQSFAMTGGSSGPMMIGYYAARFWIDQSQKH